MVRTVNYCIGCSDGIIKQAQRQVYLAEQVSSSSFSYSTLSTAIGEVGNGKLQVGFQLFQDMRDTV